MRKHIETRGELKERLKAEIERFRGLDAQKNASWVGLDVDSVPSLEEWELLKAQWKDSAEEITHIHRKLYPYFPRGTACPHCGADTMPIVGSNKHDMYGCIVCGNQVIV